jgi:hypothetical protein
MQPGRRLSLVVPEVTSVRMKDGAVWHNEVAYLRHYFDRCSLIHDEPKACNADLIVVGRMADTVWSVYFWEVSPKQWQLSALLCSCCAVESSKSVPLARLRRNQ